MQVPPMYSALKKDGKRLYELARQGETVEREPRPIRIEEIRLLELAGSRLVFRVRCSKGTYVRTLVEDIAGQADTVAHTARLHRETVGAFRGEDTIDLATVEQLAAESPEALRGRLLPVDTALADMPSVTVDATDGERFSGGQAVDVVVGHSRGLARVYGAGRFLGVGELAGNGRLAPRRVFQAPRKNPVDI